MSEAMLKNLVQLTVNLFTRSWRFYGSNRHHSAASGLKIHIKKPRPARSAGGKMVKHKTVTNGKVKKSVPSTKKSRKATDDALKVAFEPWVPQYV